MPKTKVTPHEELTQLESHLLRVDRDNWRTRADELAKALRDIGARDSARRVARCTGARWSVIAAKEWAALDRYDASRGNK